tara:strand:+ start:55 stop:453 length:399 start_codon:yes stop_codon:yes gene_type:complete
MPIIEIELLGSKIEINFKKDQKEKLLKLIENFKNRLEEFNSLEGKVSDKKILFLAALKAEDNFLELKNNSNKSLNENSVKEIIKLKDYIEKIEEKNIKLEKTNKEISNEINEIDKKISFLINKILEKDEKNN